MQIDTYMGAIALATFIWLASQALEAVWHLF